jgi:hypothetical protein
LFHIEEPSATGPQPKLGISRAKTPRPQRSENNGEEFLSNNSSLPSELGVLCALARVNSPVRVFQPSGTFAQAAKIIKDSSTKKEDLIAKDAKNKN